MARWRTLLAVACIATPLAFSQQVKNERQGARAGASAAQSGYAPSNNAPGSVTLPVSEPVKGVAPAVERQIACTKPGDENDRECQDLKAQQDMARWAWWMTIVTGVGAAIGAVTAVLVYKTFKQTRTSAEKQLRAYVGVKHGFIRIVKLTNSTRALAELKIVNSGQTIAYNVRLVLEVHVRDEGSTAPHTASKDVETYLLPGFVWEVEQATPSGVDIAEFTTDISKRRKHILVWGAVTYDTIDGNKTSEFRFTQGSAVLGDGGSLIGWNVIPTAGGKAT